VAVISLKIVEHLRRNDIEIADSSWEAWLNIDIPVSGSVTHHHTGKVYFKSVTLERGLLIILINLPSEVRYINSTIALTRDKQLVGQVLWELSKPLFERG
jgi:hypothetical protein